MGRDNSHLKGIVARLRSEASFARLDCPKSNPNRASAMETKDAYAFPLYHRVGQMARPIIASRYWIVIVLIVAILLYLPFLPSGFFQDDYGFRLNFSPAIYEKYNLPAEVMQNGPLNLYGFSWDSSARLSIEQDKGFAPVVGLRPDQDQFLPALILADAGP